jgi:hypothetical protein
MHLSAVDILLVKTAEMLREELQRVNNVADILKD